MSVTGISLYGGAYFGHMRETAARIARPPITIDLYGDSVLYGYGVDESPAQVITRLRPTWTVRNHTAGGLDTNELLNGYSTPDPGLPQEYWLGGPQPPFASVNRAGVHVVVVQTGFNDAFHSVPNYESNLRSVVQIALGEGRKVVIGGIFQVEISVPLRAIYNEMSHKIAREYNLAHAGWAEDYKGPSDVHSDTIHRNQASSNRMTYRLLETIERAYYGS